MKQRLFILSQYLLPHHLLSRLIGCVAECRIGWLKNPLISWFATQYQVNMSEAQNEDLRAFEHFNAFFTRDWRLQLEVARRFAEGPESPLADGTIVRLQLGARFVEETN